MRIHMQSNVWRRHIVLEFAFHKHKQKTESNVINAEMNMPCTIQLRMYTLLAMYDDYGY